MNYSLLLKEAYYDEIPESSSEVIVDGEPYETIEIADSFRGFERCEHFFMGTDGDIILTQTKLLIEIVGSNLSVIGTPEDELLYWNQRRIKVKTIRILRGDTFLIGRIKIVFYPDHLRLYGSEENYKCRFSAVEKRDLPYPDFPDYKRSPRIIKRVTADKIEMLLPPVKAVAQKAGLAMAILPPIASSAVTIGIGMMLGRGQYLLMSLGATAITVVVSAVRFFSDRKERKETNRKNKERYEVYMLKKRKEISRAYRTEVEAYRYNYPEVVQINRMVHSFDSRIYERMASDKDFLVFSIGRKYSPTAFTINFPEDSLTEEKNELYEDAAALKKEYRAIWKEVAVDLKRAHLGLVGEKKIIHQQLQTYLCQVVAFHSYHDLQIIALYDGKFSAEFDWLKWLPHCRLQMLNVRGLIHSERARDQILNSMNQILKERQQKLEESKKEAKFLPHYLFVIDEPKFIMDHSIMEYLNGSGEQLGFSIIYTSYLRANLPEHIGTVLMLEHGKEGTLLLHEKEFRDEKIKLQTGWRINLELFARDLGVLNHLLGTTSHIPESITFFELYNVLWPEELEISKRWKTHFADRSLAVPLGVRAKNDVVELNLHERAHGPHGLVAGTTGSGKSETIQSYILSLAVNFHPHEVGFLLIDYKGGGMAGLFRNLPHLLGTITNLDGSESMRALASIKSELARRQRIFSENSVNHINSYMELFREGKVPEPIPHLFLISNEFAELKKEQPDFMKELVSTARIGRSLGVHLILATQKPTGVVDDQIWTNSKFKLALKVQDEGDSKEILKTPDAASITQAGRAYLQVGNNEIYELFQSAWSGAIFVKEKEKEVTLDNRVYLVNDLGQRQLVNQDLGGTKAEKAAKETQLDVTISHIRDVLAQEQPIVVKKPWLPALAPVLLSPCYEHSQNRKAEDFTISVPIGVVDIPEEQTQEEYLLNLTEDGNLMYIASSGFGKSVLLTTAALGLARTYRVNQINLFILDFGNNALIFLKKLPHTSEYITLDDTDRYGKWKRLLAQEIKRRKKLMAEIFAQNFQIYNQTAEQPFCAWVILVDNFDAVKEMGFEEEEYFTRMTRDGFGLGIYFIIAASRNNAIRGATFNSFKNKVAGYNFEKGEILNLIGRSPYTLPEIKGRSLLKYQDRVSCMQIYSMVPFSNDLEYRGGINELVEQIRRENPDQEAPHMPIMPEDLDIVAMKMLVRNQRPEVDLYIGLETEKVTVEGIRMRHSPLTVLGNPGSGKTNLLKIFLHQLEGKAEVVLFDSPNRDLKNYERREGFCLVKNMSQFVSFMDKLEKEVIRREQEIDGQPEEQEAVIIEGMRPYVIMIDDLTVFYSRQTTSEEEISEMFGRAATVGILIVATNPLAKFYGNDPVSEFFKRSPYGVLLSPQGHLNVAPVTLTPDTNGGAFYKKGYSVIVRIPKA